MARFNVIRYLPHNAAANSHLEVLPVEILPLDRNQFGKPKPQTHVEQQHSAERFLTDRSEQRLKFFNREHAWFFLADRAALNHHELGIMASILTAIHMRSAGDLFGTPSGTPDSDSLISAPV